jgi:type II secretory pathway pseudopilin PulG
MSIPFSFPDWMPWWGQLLVVITMILLALAFALMPFSVFGTKSRLEAMEARLDEIQGEIRALSLRLPEPARRGAYEVEPPLPVAPPPITRTAPPPARPPIPPAAWSPDAGPRRPIGTPAPPLRTEPESYRPGPGPGPRLEPRIDRGR